MSTKNLVSLCHKIARKGPLWVQGQGGNLSVKTGPFLFIKASGVRLDQVRKKKGLVRIGMNNVQRRIFRIRGTSDKAEESYAAILKSSAGHNGIRPSMEAGIHLALAKPYVLHFHSLPALLMSHEFKKNPTKMAAWLKNNWREHFVFVKPFRPGLLLSRWIHRHRTASLFLLENHGVVLQAHSPRVLDRWEETEKKFCRAWGYQRVYNPDRGKPAPLRLYFPDSAVFLDRLKNVLKKVSSVRGEPAYILRPGAWKKDREASEIWQATETLYHVCPPLGQLPRSIAIKVAHLPTELYRRKRPNKS